MEPLENIGPVVDTRLINPSIVKPALDVDSEEAKSANKSDAASVENSEEALQDTEQGKESEDVDEATLESKRPKGLAFVLLFSCLVLGSFFIGYDTSCIATLTPVITDEFHALNSFGWYSIAYVMAQCATMLIYGQLYSFYSMKTMYMLSWAIFVVGSVITATAPSSPVFIFGRALNGLGSAGAFAGTNIIIAQTTSLRHRATYMAVSGSVECAALAFGPLISGVIAHFSNWRVAFYIIIPIGVMIIAAVFFFVKDLRRPENAHLTGHQKLQRLDLTGFAVNVPFSLCLALGLQWAGTEYAWSNWRIILLLVLAGVLAILFLAAEYRAGTRAMLPLRMLRQRSVAFASIITFCNYATLSVIGYYLPFYFQAVRGSSTLGSGLMYLPLAVAMSISVMAGGPATSYIGYYAPVMILGSVLMVVGAGLLTTFTPTIAEGKWIGYQILYGAGLGLTFQQPYTAVQTVVPELQVPTALVTLSFMQQFGGIVSIAIAQNVFANKLASNLAAQVPGFAPSLVKQIGALKILDQVPAQYRDAGLRAYTSALVDVFYIALALTCLVVVSVLGVEWKSVKKEKRENGSKEEEKVEERDQKDEVGKQ